MLSALLLALVMMDPRKGKKKKGRKSRREGNGRVECEAN